MATNHELELADGAAEELHGQRPLPLWASYDPNLFKMGCFIFHVDMAKLRCAVNAVSIPKRSAVTNFVEITSSELRIRGFTKDRSFCCSARVSLLKDSNIGPKPIAFEIERELLKSLSKVIPDGSVEFELNKNTGALSFSRGIPGDTRVNVPVKWLPIIEEDPNWIRQGVPNLNLLRQAIDYVTPMASRDRKFRLSGVQFENRAAFGCYQEGISKFHSADLPDGAFRIPLDQIANVRAILGRLRGHTMRLVGDDEQGFASEFMACCWTNTPDWSSAVPDRAFSMRVTTSIRVPARKLLDMVTIAIIGCERVLIAIKQEGARCRLLLTGVGPTRPFRGLLDGELILAETAPPSEVSQSVLSFKVKDLKAIMLADKEDEVTLGLSDKGLILTHGNEKHWVARSALSGRAES